MTQSISVSKTKTSNTVTCNIKEKQLLVSPNYFPSLSHKVVDWIFSGWRKSSILPGGRQTDERTAWCGQYALGTEVVFFVNLPFFNVTITWSTFFTEVMLNHTLLVSTVKLANDQTDVHDHSQLKSGMDKLCLIATDCNTLADKFCFSCQLLSITSCLIYALTSATSWRTVNEPLPLNIVIYETCPIYLFLVNCLVYVSSVRKKLNFKSQAIYTEIQYQLLC